MSSALIRKIETDFSLQKRQAQAPKYQLLFNTILDAIHTGMINPGDKLPSEASFAAQLPISLGTVQKSLKLLTECGAISRNGRSGTIVNGQLTSNEDVYVYRFSDPITGDVLLPFVRILTIKEDKTPGPWQDFLQTDHLIRIERLLWVEQDPPAFSQFYLPYALGKFLLDIPLEALHGISTHKALVDRFNLPTVRFEHRVSCRQLINDVCRQVLVPEETFGTVWDIRGYSFRDSPNTYQRIQLPAGHRPLEITVNLASLPPANTAKIGAV